MATENEQYRREWWRFIIGSIAALVVGIGLTSFDIAFWARESAKAERLRAYGVLVVAFTSDFEPIGRSRTYPASVKVTYTYQDYGTASASSARTGRAAGAERRRI